MKARHAPLRAMVEPSNLINGGGPKLNDNGILPRIPSQFVAAALTKLSIAGSSLGTVRETEFDVPDIGRVRFTAELRSSKRTKWGRNFWTATRATPVE